MRSSRVPKVWRCVSLAALFNVTIPAAGAAQTVVVRNVPPGQPVEVYVNGAQAGGGTVGSDGIAEIPIDLRAATGAEEMDSRIYVDVCESLRRILIVNRNIQPAVREEGCGRREIQGVFWVRQRSTLVIDAGAVIPTMLLRQGKYDPTAGTFRVLSPRGIIVFGGGGITRLDNPVRVSCGTVTDCDGDASVMSVTAGLDIWATRWLGVEGAYIKPRKITTQGTGGTFTFSDSYDAHIVTAAAKLGIPIGRARMYAKGGGTFHSATTSSDVTIDDVTQTVKLRTEGWGWLAGGGVEVWTGRRFALYAEAVFGKIKGNAVGEDVEGIANDKAMSVFGGFRVRLF